MLLILTLLLSAVDCFRIEFNRSDSMQYHQITHLDAFEIKHESFECGCLDKKEIKKIQEKLWSPEDFIIDHGDFWLGSIEALESKSCGQLCLAFNQRTTHYSFEGEQFFFSIHSRKFCRLSAHHSGKTALDLELISLDLLKLQERYVLCWKA